MNFVRQASAATVLIALTLSFQSAGMAALIHWGRAHFARDVYPLSVVRSALLMVRFTSVMVVLHLLQIMLWAGFYRWNCFPYWESAFYFSTISYSTVGYGDLVLPRMWRNLGPVESITGVLMCGLSASFLFAVVTQLAQRHAQHASGLAKPAADRPSPRAEDETRAVVVRGWPSSGPRGGMND
jgi:voltage-gated potassium channel